MKLKCPLEILSCFYSFLYKIRNFDFGLVGSLDGLQFDSKSEIKISLQQIFIANL